MKTICITGAGGGLGAGLARRLARPDRHLILHYHQNHDGAQKVYGELSSEYASIELVQADLGTEKGAIHLAEAIQSIHPSLEVLINNSGVYHEKPWPELTEAEWQQEWNTTASSVFFTIRACVDLLRAAGHAHVINIRDSSCDKPGARDLAIAYHIGKTGVLMLTKSFARDLAADQISVNMISPSYLEKSVGLPDPTTIPAGRFTTFDDVAKTIEQLLTNKEPILTGSNLILSGGWNLR